MADPVKSRQTRQRDTTSARRDAKTAQPSYAVGVRQHMRSLIDRVDASLAALRAGRNDEALHDFRVNIRRLRTLLTTFSDVVELDKRDTRCLRALAHCTNDARDLEVAAQLLQSHAPRVKPQQRRAFASRARRYREQAQHNAAMLRKKLHAQWASVRRRLPTSERSLHAAERSAYARETARRVTPLLHELRRTLRKVKSVGDIDAMHRARIVAKKVRYLLEPFTAVAPALDAARKELVKLQDTLGTIHDNVLLAERIKGEAVRAAQASCLALFDTRGHVARASSRTLLVDIALYRSVQREARRAFVAANGKLFGPRAKMVVQRLRTQSAALLHC